MTKHLTKHDPAPEFRLENANEEWVTLDTFAGKPLALIFTRYVGCPVCQMDTIEYKNHYEAIKKAGLDVAMVFQSSTQKLNEFAVKELLPFAALSDPKRNAYQRYGVGAGLTGFLSPKNLSPLINAVKSGHRHGKFEGNEFQYPAAFIIDENKHILHAYYGKTISDGLHPSELLNIYHAK